MIFMVHSGSTLINFSFRKMSKLLGRCKDSLAAAFICSSKLQHTYTYNFYLVKNICSFWMLQHFGCSQWLGNVMFPPTNVNLLKAIYEAFHQFHFLYALRNGNVLEF